MNLLIAGSNRIYVLFILLCTAGYIWLFYSLNHPVSDDTSLHACWIKQATGIPCPSCGSTRSAMALMNGEFFSAISINPIGIILLAGLLLLPFWMLFDKLSGKQSLPDFYLKAERTLRQPKIAIPLIILVLMNWAWNIAKGL